MFFLFCLFVQLTKINKKHTLSIINLQEEKKRTKMMNRYLRSLNKRKNFNFQSLSNTSFCYHFFFMFSFFFYDDVSIFSFLLYSPSESMNKYEAHTYIYIYIYIYAYIIIQYLYMRLYTWVCSRSFLVLCNIVILFLSIYINILLIGYC
jgi:Na+/melibiose symporter-like transporter